MKKILSIILTLTLSATVFAQPLPKKLEHNEKMAWWRNAKFGMFMHWGPYCLYGGVYNGFNQRRGGAEWIMNRCKIPVREYRAKACTFNPVDFNAEELVLTAKNAGMKYIIFTTKHHDGFAMFKSNASEFNIVDYTPFKRDIVDELAKACRKHHIKLGFYYSQTQDWCNPGGGTIRKEMKEGWANPDSVAIDNFTQENLGGWDCLQRSASLDDYFRKVAIPQIKELLTNYGDVAVMWWDTPHRISKETAAEITAELAKYPQVITNDRLRRPDFPGDYKTPEGRIPHAQLFCGPAGVGKLPLALAYARYICCPNRTETDACGTCPSCVKWNKLVHPDVHFVYPIVKSAKGKKYEYYIDCREKPDVFSRRYCYITSFCIINNCT